MKSKLLLLVLLGGLAAGCDTYLPMVNQVGGSGFA
jgi:hypothetical protein